MGTMAKTGEYSQKSCNGSGKEQKEMVDWLNSLALSRPVKNADRDLADAVLVAELIGHYLPRYVTLNTFAHVHSVALKKYNWESLDKVVLRHLGIRLGQETIENLAQGHVAAFQTFLPLLRTKIDEALEQRRFRPSSRSRPSSRGGSQLHLDRIGLGTTSSWSSPQAGEASQQKNSTAAGGSRVPVLDEMDKDQLIERLYTKVRIQEAQLARKDEQIEVLTRRMEKLVEMICEEKRRKGVRGMDNGGEGHLAMNHDFD